MNTKRYALLDIIRGITLISMIVYHTIWDMVYIFDVDWLWFESTAAYVWQQSICWCFILLSGFCWSLGKHKLKRGLIVFIAGALVSIVTIIVIPEESILFGVLTFLGTAMLLFIPLNFVLKHCNPWIGAIVSAILFFITRNINERALGFEGIHITDLPETIYQGNLATFCGFTERGFYSTDYFSLLPWLFLFAVGYFLYGIFQRKELFSVLEKGKCEFLEKFGKHSLLIYMLHQPLVYLILTLVFMVV